MRRLGRLGVVRRFLGRGSRRGHGQGGKQDEGDDADHAP
jgi:hypothetical protein